MFCDVVPRLALNFSLSRVSEFFHKSAPLILLRLYSARKGTFTINSTYCLWSFSIYERSLSLYWLNSLWMNKKTPSSHEVLKEADKKAKTVNWIFVSVLLSWTKLKSLSIFTDHLLQNHADIFATAALLHSHSKVCTWIKY